MKKKTAVYIDGENIPAKKSERILKAIRKKGGYDSVKVYGMQKDPATKAWTKEAAQINGAKDIRLSGRPQKNKVDNKIKQDIAKDIRSNRMETVVIVSSDHGYASSAREARAQGKTVIGIGGKNASKKLVSSCDEYIFI